MEQQAPLVEILVSLWTKAPTYYTTHTITSNDMKTEEHILTLCNSDSTQKYQVGKCRDHILPGNRYDTTMK